MVNLFDIWLQRNGAFSFSQIVHLEPSYREIILTRKIYRSSPLITQYFIILGSSLLTHYHL